MERNEMLRYFRDVRGGGGQWKAFCPVCEPDKTTGSRHLQISFGNDGRLLLTCFHGCDFKSIIKAAGLPSNNGSGRCENPPAAPVKRPKRRTYASIEAAIESQQRRIRGTSSGTWTYTDSFAVARFDKPDGSKQFLPFHRNGGGWQCGDPEGTLPLYGIDRLTADGAVLIVEGEKCCDSAASIGVFAITSAHGAKSPGKSDWAPLAGRDVCLWPDKDDAGRKYADAVAAILTPLGCNVRIIEPSDELETGGDIADWLEVRDAVEPESLREQVINLMNAAPPCSAPPATTATAQDATDIPLTDVGAGQRFANRFADELRFIDRWGCWARWTGTHWQRDADAAARQAAKRLARDLQHEAVELNDSDVKKRIFKYAVGLERSAGVNATLAMAYTEPAFYTRPESYDTRDNLLNTPEGTYDLNSGNVYPHRRDDLITQCTAADPRGEGLPYRNAPPNDVWARFLWQSQGGELDDNGMPMHDDETAERCAFLQRAAGSILYGGNPEEKLYLIVGAPASGKGTFQNALHGALGDYARTLDMDAIQQAREPRSHKAGLAHLAGCRLALGAEIDPNTRLNLATIKAMTGGDTLQVSGKGEKPFELRPSWTILVSCEEMPRLPDDERDGIWRRLVPLKFPHQVPEMERDPNLKLYLADPQRGGPVVLRWLIEGCRLWKHVGLLVPECVRDDAAEYRRMLNPVHNFIADCIVFEDGAETTARDLKEAFKEFTNGKGRYGSKVTDEFRRHGGESDDVKNDGKTVVVWRNVRLV